MKKKDCKEDTVLIVSLIGEDQIGKDDGRERHRKRNRQWRVTNPIILIYETSSSCCPSFALPVIIIRVSSALSRTAG